MALSERLSKFASLSPNSGGAIFRIQCRSLIGEERNASGSGGAGGFEFASRQDCGSVVGPPAGKQRGEIDLPELEVTRDPESPSQTSDGKLNDFHAVGAEPKTPLATDEPPDGRRIPMGVRADKREVAGDHVDLASDAVTIWICR